MTKNNRFIPAFEEGHFYGIVDEGEYLRQSLLYKQILPRPVRRRGSFVALAKKHSEGGTPSRPKTSMISVSKNLRNLPLKICEICVLSFQPLTSTKDYVRKNKLFIQNKANFLDDQMNVTSFITTSYKQRTMNYEIKNKPNTNPIQTQYKANTNPIRTRFKPKQTQFQGKENAELNDQKPASCRGIPDTPIAIRLMIKTGLRPIYNLRTRSTIKQYIANVEKDSFSYPGFDNQHHRAGRNCKKVLAEP